jgi:hypothetical protein
MPVIPQFKNKTIGIAKMIKPQKTLEQIEREEDWKNEFEVRLHLISVLASVLMIGVIIGLVIGKQIYG